MEQQYYEIASNFTPVFNIALALLKGRGCEEICNTIPDKGTHNFFIFNITTSPNLRKCPWAEG